MPVVLVCLTRRARSSGGPEQKHSLRAVAGSSHMSPPLPPTHPIRGTQSWSTCGTLGTQQHTELQAAANTDVHLRTPSCISPAAAVTTEAGTESPARSCLVHAQWTGTLRLPACLQAAVGYCCRSGIH